MDVHCILIEIVNGKQARSASSMLTRIEDNTDNARTSTDIIFTCILLDTVMHVTVNMDGARRCCSVVLMLGYRRQRQHRFASLGAYPVYIYSPG